MIDLLPGSGKTSKREEEETKERGNVGVMSFVYTQKTESPSTSIS